MLLGIVGVLVASRSGSAVVPPYLSSVLDQLGISEPVSMQTIGAIVVIAAGFLIAKGVAAALLARLMFSFLGRAQARASISLSTSVLARPLVDIEARSSHEVAYTLTRGVFSAITQVLGFSSLAVAEICLLAVLGAALFVLAPSVSIVAVSYFFGVAYLLQRSLRHWSVQLGSQVARASVSSLRSIPKAIHAYREVTVLGRRDSFGRMFHPAIENLASAQSNILFVGQVPRFAYEIALVLGGAIVAAWTAWTQGEGGVLPTLVLFLAAGSRVFPSILRLNGLVLGIRTAAGEASSLLDLASMGHGPQGSTSSPAAPRSAEVDSTAASQQAPVSVLFEGVTFTYSVNSEPVLEGIDLWIEGGGNYAIVGKSGTGKTTLVELMLGLTDPTVGSVTIDGQCPQFLIADRPGVAAYVPQSVSLLDGSVTQNVAIGLPAGSVDENRFWECLRLVELDDVFRSGRNGLQTQIGERGFQISGGQRQRLGLARALYANPSLLVLDEATSALDAETEATIASVLQILRDRRTIVTVAHRLSTIRRSDIVLVIDQRGIAASCSFEQLRETWPDFAKQVALLNLGP